MRRSCPQCADEATGAEPQAEGVAALLAEEECGLAPGGDGAAALVAALAAALASALAAFLMASRTLLLTAPEESTGKLELPITLKRGCAYKPSYTTAPGGEFSSREEE